MNGSFEFGLYVITTDDGYAKIGVSQDPEARIQQVQSCSPHALRLVLFISVAPVVVQTGMRRRAGLTRAQFERKVAVECERYFHWLFREKHLHGEWFRLCDSDYNRIREDLDQLIRTPWESWPTRLIFFSCPDCGAERMRAITQKRCDGCVSRVAKAAL